MKHLAVALIVITLLACDFGSDYFELTAHEDEWNWASTLGLLFAFIWFTAAGPNDRTNA